MYLLMQTRVLGLVKMKTAACMPVSGEAWMQTCVFVGVYACFFSDMIVIACAGVLSQPPLLLPSSHPSTVSRPRPRRTRGVFPLLLRHDPSSPASGLWRSRGFAHPCLGPRRSLCMHLLSVSMQTSMFCYVQCWPARYPWVAGPRLSSR